MKKLLLLAITAMPLFSFAAPADDKGDMLEYITPEVFKTELLAGKIKPNTFYWANQMGDQTLAPKPKMDGDIPFLELTGGTSPTVAGGQNSFLYRIIPIPEGNKTKATITAEFNYEPDLWAGRAPTATGATVSAFFTDGKRCSGDMAVGPARLPKMATWTKITGTVPVPPGAKFIGITVTAPMSFIARIRNINIAFE